MIDTPQEAAIGEKAARDLMATEACLLFVAYSEATTTDDDILDLMYANALAAAKKAIKGKA